MAEYNETLADNETLIDNLQINVVVEQSAKDSDNAGAVDNTEVSKGVYKVFNNIMYNQHQVDAYACTLVSAFTALANSKNIDVPLEIMLAAFEEYKASGEFTPGFGGSIENGAKHALKAFNAWAGTNVQMEVKPFTIQNAISCLNGGFAFTSGIHYGSHYFANEQDDGVIENQSGTVGSNGHAVAFVKVNTIDDQLIKFVENYHGELKFDIILADFIKNRPLFFNNMVAFYEA